MSFLNKIGGYFGVNGEDEYDETEENYTDDMPFDESEEEKRNKVVKINATAQLQVILVSPKFLQIQSRLPTISTQRRQLFSILNQQLPM